MKYQADGLTEAQWETWRQDPSGMATQINNKMTRTVLPEDDGHKVVLMKMKMPMMITNRSIVSCFYEHQREDGWKVLLHSSQGNDHIVAANKSAIGKDVVADMVITYYAWRPYEGGLEIWHINKMNPAGSIPDFLKNKMAKRMANGVLNLVNFIKTGAKPADD